MLKKNYFLVGLLLGILLIVSACSDDKKPSTETPKSTESASGLLVLSGDTVSEQGGCVLASRFSAGDKIVFRMNAINPDTNEQAKEAKLKVHLSTGEVLDMVYGKHGDDNFWVIAYPVTADTPTGTLEYHVTGEDGDKKGEFRPFNVAPSLISIVDPSAATAPKPEAEKEAPEDTTKVETNQKVNLIAKNFTFLNEAGDDKFYVKAGEEVTINLKSEEGLHGFDIEGLDVTLADANGTVKFTPKEAGEFPIICNVFCGAGHGDMKSTLVVVK